MMLAELAPVLQGNVHVGLAFGGAAIGIGIAAAGATMAIGRNPGMFGRVVAIMILGIALAEGAAILAFVLGKAH